MFRLFVSVAVLALAAARMLKEETVDTGRELVRLSAQCAVSPFFPATYDWAHTESLRPVCA
jgi:hypothetical protein